MANFFNLILFLMEQKLMDKSYLPLSISKFEVTFIKSIFSWATHPKLRISCVNLHRSLLWVLMRTDWFPCKLFQTIISQKFRSK